MSYEGYEVYYCKNGHRIGSWDVYDPDSPSGYCGIFDKKLRCPICGLVEYVVDCVDQTNGCECEYTLKETGKKCGSHPKVDKIVGYTGVDCERCSGEKLVKIPDIYESVPCSKCGVDVTLPGSPVFEDNDPCSACEDCFGMGVTRMPISFVLIECPDCRGTGKSYVPIYDISPIVRDE